MGLNSFSFPFLGPHAALSWGALWMVPHCLGTALSYWEQTAQTGQLSQGAAVCQHPQEQQLHIGHHNLRLIIKAPQILKKNPPYLSPSPMCQARMDPERCLREDEAVASDMKVSQSMCPQHPSARPPSKSDFPSPLLHVETRPAGTERYGPLLSTPRANGWVGHVSCTELVQVFVMCLFRHRCIHLMPQALAEGLSGRAEEDSNACSVERSVARPRLPSSPEWRCCSQHGWAFSGFYFCKFAERISTYRSWGAVVMLCKPDRPPEHFSASAVFNNWYLSAFPHNPSHQHYTSNSKPGATQIHEQGCVTDRLVCWTHRCWIPSFLDCFLNVHIKPHKSHDPLSYPKLPSMDFTPGSTPRSQLSWHFTTGLPTGDGTHVATEAGHTEGVRELLVPTQRQAAPNLCL